MNALTTALWEQMANGRAPGLYSGRGRAGASIGQATGTYWSHSWLGTHAGHVPGRWEQVLSAGLLMLQRNIKHEKYSNPDDGIKIGHARA